MNLDLKDKTIVITGASGFLGLHLQKELVLEGANVIGVDIKGSHNVRKLDISNDHEVEDFVADLASLNTQVDGLVNCACVSYKGYKLEENQIDKTLAVNIKGANNCIVRLLPIMPRGSAIVNIASVYGMVSPNPDLYNNTPELYNSPMYGATKAGLIQLTRYYASHYLENDGVRVNCVSPGGIWQNHSDEFYQAYIKKTPMGKMAQVDQIVKPVLFLLSPASDYINGHNLVVDGGFSVW